MGTSNFPKCTLRTVIIKSQFPLDNKTKNLEEK